MLSKPLSDPEVLSVAVLAQCGEELCDNWLRVTEKA